MLYIYIYIYQHIYSYVYMCACSCPRYHPMFGEHRLFAGFLICFVIFGSFGMIALLTGVVHRVAAAAPHTPHNRITARASCGRRSRYTSRVLRCARLRRHAAAGIRTEPTAVGEPERAVSA